MAPFRPLWRRDNVLTSGTARPGPDAPAGLPPAQSSAAAPGRTAPSPSGRGEWPGQCSWPNGLACRSDLPAIWFPGQTRSTPTRAASGRRCKTASASSARSEVSVCSRKPTKAVCTRHDEPEQISSSPCGLSASGPAKKGRKGLRGGWFRSNAKGFNTMAPRRESLPICATELV